MSTYVKYVNTFVCQKYLHKIVVLHISVSALPETDMQSTSKYVACTNVLTYFTHVETFVVNTYLFKYFEYAKG